MSSLSRAVTRRGEIATRFGPRFPSGVAALSGCSFVANEVLAPHGLLLHAGDMVQMGAHHGKRFVHERFDFGIFRFGRLFLEFIHIHFVVLNHAIDIRVVEFYALQGRQFIHHPLMFCVEAFGQGHTLLGRQGF